MKGKHVLITGGTGGLGSSVTSAVLAQGAASITIPYISMRSVDRLKGTLSFEQTSKLNFVEADLIDERSVENLLNGMERVDALIHLVGGFSMGKTHEYSYDQWRQDFDLNLSTTFLVCKHSLRRMLDQNYGRIVTIGSRGAVQPGGQLAAYCASKAGVVALTQAIADEAKGKNIVANVVLPSLIDTPSNRAAMDDETMNQAVKPDSLAQVICFLASEAAKDIRGAVVPVYGNT